MGVLGILVDLLILLVLLRASFMILRCCCVFMLNKKNKMIFLSNKFSLQFNLFNIRKKFIDIKIFILVMLKLMYLFYHFYFQ